MSIYSLPPLISSLLFILLGVFALVKSKKNASLIFPFFLTSFVTFWWQFSWFILFNTKDPVLASNIVRIGYSGITFIPVTFFHFYSSFLQEDRNKKWIYIYYIVASIFLILLWTTNLYIDGFYLYSWGYYPKAGILHPVYLFYLVMSASHSFYSLIISGFKARWSGVKSDQIKYLILSFFVYCFAASDFIVNYGIELYPLGFSSILICLFIVAFAIVRYRLLDIKIVITRAGIFIGIYSVVLGIPFALAFGYQEQLQHLIGRNWWIVPLISSTVLATAGPLIYLFLQKKAEGRILEEQHEYQSTLRKASMGMGRIKDLKKLLNLIVHIVVRAVKIENCEVYLWHEESKSYVLKASKSYTVVPDPSQSIKSDFEIVQMLKKQKEPLVYEEMKQKMQDYGDKALNNAVATMEEINASILVPSFIENKLIAIVSLGKKKSGKPFSQDDLVVFSILANQSALAIENAIFYEESKRTQEQLFNAEKMATIGTMADGLSHQINNRLHAMGFIAGDAIDTINMKEKENLPEDIKKTLDDVKYSLKRIEENVKQGGEIVSGLLKYTRKGETGMEAVDLQLLLKSAMEMVQFKIKTSQMKLVSEIDENSPKVWGNFTQLQEVFFNVIDNSYDAMMQKKDELKEEGYQPTIHISAMSFDSKVEIKVQDNGIGVKSENIEKLFAPFFTTKATSKKGTGLGLYVIRQLIEGNHNGKVDFKSEYKIGSQTRITLSVARKKG